MFLSYLKIALRNIKRNKLTSSISILGFTIGITIIIMIFLFINYEFTYDAFHNNSNSIFCATLLNNDNKTSNISTGFADKVVMTFPQIEYSAKVLERMTEVKSGNDIYNEPVTFTDMDYFKMFYSEIIEGDIKGFNANPSNIVLTFTAAQKYFGNSTAIGKIIALKVDDKYEDYLVTAVIKDWPDNSSLKPFIILPYINAKKISILQFMDSEMVPNDYAPYFFVKLKNPESRKDIVKQFSSIVPPGVIKKDGKMEFSLTPLKDIHFSTDIHYTTIKTVNIQTSYILLGIGILILGIISLNYVNLSMGKFSHRFEEIGIRKLVGADKKRIMTQFLGESVITVIISAWLSIILCIIMLPYFNALTLKKMSMTTLLSPFPFTIIASLLIIVGLCAGGYPALFLSKISIVSTLKGNYKISGSKVISKILLTVQFVIAMFFMLGAVIINMQYSYLTNKNLGFDKRNKILIKTNEMFGRHIDENSLRLYRDELKKNSMVKNASLSDMILGGNERIVGMSGFDYRGSSFFSYIFNIDEGANGTIGLKLKQGHMFLNDSSSDTTNTVIVNEAFVKAMGTTNALNETIGFWNKKQKTIIGIAKDFNYKSLKEKVTPIIFTNYKKQMTECLYVQYQTKDIQCLLSYMKTTWDKYFPDMAFKYSFLDERMDNLYSEERKWKDIISYTSIIAVALACMGLFGMTLFSIQKRTKEIGIRKILGATAGNISIMLSKQFIALVVISDLIACPAAYYFMNKWLQNFAYRIDISWWIFVLSGGAALLIAILTVSYQAIKAATANPVEALRYE